MDRLERFTNISVLGAAGKMGSGILLLNVLHSAQLMHQPGFEGRTFIINAIDQSFEQLNALNTYLKQQVLKWAEKNIVWLRKAYHHRPHLIDNKDVIDTFVFEALNLVKPSINVESAYQSTLVFEAIIEDEYIKTQVLKQINENNPNTPWFLTNTSSIPISVLDKNAGLNGRLIGCHFYNPPAVQKLIEVIELPNGLPELSEMVYGFGKHMKKVMIPSNDVAGFIGNGFFMRDIMYAGNKVEELKRTHGYATSIIAMDSVSRDLLVRPMGIFQLIDYVGIDVCAFILQVMDHHLPETLESEQLNLLLRKGIKGGQFPDGSQKDGFFKYENNSIVGVFDLETNEYHSLSSMEDKVNPLIETETKGYNWKQLSRSTHKDEHLEHFFKSLFQENTFASRLAKDYMKSMLEIGQQLVERGVARSAEDVNQVMINGFYHLYGPVNNYI